MIQSVRMAALLRRLARSPIPPPRMLAAAALLGIIAAALLVNGAFSDEPVAYAQAQGPLPPHDLSIELRDPRLDETTSQRRSWLLVLTNRGRRDVHRGQVRFSVTPHATDAAIVISKAEDYNPKRGHFDLKEGIWHFRNLPAGQSTKMRLRIEFKDGPARQYTYNHLVIGRAEIVSSVPREEYRFLYNNVTAEHWRTQGGNENWSAYANGDVGVDGIRVNNRFPEMNEAVEIIVEANNIESSVGRVRVERDMDVYGVRVKVGLSPGLKFDRAQAPAGTTFSSSTGIWDVGLLSGTSKPGEVRSQRLRVSVRYTGAVPREDACLTAELVNVVPPEHPDREHQRNNHARVCLGVDPIVPIAEGDFTLIDFYPCVGITAYPCNVQDSLELLVPITPGQLRRDSGIGRVDTPVGEKKRLFLPPKTILFQLQAGGYLPVDTRVASDTGPIHWSTANLFDLGDSQKRLPDTTWSAARLDFTVTGSNGGPAPGTLTINYSEADDIVLSDTKKVVGESFDIDNTYDDLDLNLVFSNLGTYVLTTDIRATHKTAGQLTATGAYTFHVGPVAELEVQAAWAAPGVFTLTALNHGPDEAPAAQVEVTLPPGLRVVRSEANQGSYDPSTGVWDIGTLELPGYWRALNLPEGATLTIHTAGVPEGQVTASIENTQDYCVRIKTGATSPYNDLECVGPLPAGYTEHSAEYYDYRPANNRFETTSEGYFDTAGRIAPALTARPSGQNAVVLSWAAASVPPGTLTGYQLQASSDGGAIWTDLTTVGAGVRTHTHQGLQPGATYHYRVRATDSGGGDNPWSNTATASTFVLGVPANLRTDGKDKKPTSTTITLEWEAATGATGYEIQVSPDGGATWNDLATLDDGAATTYTHQGLTTGVTRHYRVRATGAGNSLSAWSNVASARTEELQFVPGVRVVQKPGYYPAVLEWGTLEDPTIIGYEYQRSDYPDVWIPLTDRYYGTSGGNEYVQPGHLTAYCVCADPSEPPYEPWLNYSDWVGSGITFTVRILREDAPEPTPTPSGQGQQRGEPGSAEPPPTPTPTPTPPPNTAPEFDRDTAWADYCVNAGAGAGAEVARVRADDQDGDALQFFRVGGFDEVADNHFSVSTVKSGEVYWGVIRVSRTIPGDLEDQEGFDGWIVIDLEVIDGRGGLDQIGVALQYDPAGDNCQESSSRSTTSGDNGASVLVAVGGWLRGIGDGIGQLFDAVGRLSGGFYRNWETAGAGPNVFPQSAAVWGWWPY